MNNSTSNSNHIKSTEPDRKSVLLLGSVVSFLFTFLMCRERIVDNDTLWHIKVGEWVINNKTIPKEDIFSFHENLKWVTHEIGWDVPLYLIYNYFGCTGLLVLRTVCMLCIFILLLAILVFNSKIFILLLYNNLKYIKGYGLSFWLFSTYAMLGGYYVCRPEDFSNILLLFIIIIYTNEDTTNKLKYIALPITMLIMSWTHGGFILTVIGTMLLLIVVDVCKIIQTLENNYKSELRIKFIALSIGFVLSLTNPCGINIYTYYFYMGSDVNSKQLGWVTFDFKDSTSLLLYLIFVLVSVSFSNLKELEYRSVQRSIIAAAWIFLGVYQRRCMTQALFFSILLIYPYMNDMINTIWSNLTNSFNSVKASTIYKLSRIKSGVFFSVCILSVLPLGGFMSSQLSESNTKEYTNKYILKDYSKGVVEYMQQHPELFDSNYYNSYLTGGFLIYNDIKVFIDSRCDPYIAEDSSGSSIYDDVMSVNANINSDAISNLCNKYDLKYLILHPCANSGQSADSYYYNVIKDDDRFKLIYEDTSKETLSEYNEKYYKSNVGYIYEYLATE